MKKTFENWAYHDYTTKLSVSIVYALIASVALNFFYQPGHIYSSGITGLAQILTTLSKSLIGFEVPVSTTLYLLNIPLFVLAWLKIGKKFTIFTFITVTLTSLCIHILPETVLSTDPIICALFGGAVMGLGIGLALRNGLSSGGLDIVSITIRKKTGKSIGSISIYFNALIVFVAGILFGWQYMFYRITIINEAEGAYKHDKQTVLMTIVTRYELPLLREAMKASDPQAFVSIAENVQILGRFYEDGI